MLTSKRSGFKSHFQQALGQYIDEGPPGTNLKRGGIPPRSRKRNEGGLITAELFCSIFAPFTGAMEQMIETRGDSIAVC